MQCEKGTDCKEKTYITGNDEFSQGDSELYGTTQPGATPTTTSTHTTHTIKNTTATHTTFQIVLTPTATASITSQRTFGYYS